jgi:hypothetical protein
MRLPLAAYRHDAFYTWELGEKNHLGFTRRIMTVVFSENQNLSGSSTRILREVDRSMAPQIRRSVACTKFGFLFFYFYYEQEQKWMDIFWDFPLQEI